MIAATLGLGKYENIEKRQRDWTTGNVSIPGRCYGVEGWHNDV